LSLITEGGNAIYAREPTSKAAQAGIGRMLLITTLPPEEKGGLWNGSPGS